MRKPPMSERVLVGEEVSILYWRCRPGSQELFNEAWSVMFQFSIGDARDDVAVVDPHAADLVSILYWRCTGLKPEEVV